MARTSRVAMSLTFAAVLVSTAACGGTSGGTSEDGSSEAVTIRFADTLPESHFISKDHSQRFIETAESLAEEEGHDLTIEFFPDGQLGDAADQIANMQNGVFDMGLVSPAYGPEAQPVGDLFNLPQTATSAEVLANAYYSLLMEEESILFKRDFADNELRPLSSFALPLYQIALTSEFDGIESVQEKKIRSGGGAQNDTIKALGGTPVTLTTAEQYEGLQRGIIDGGIFNTPSMVDNKTGEVLKSFTTNADVAGFVGGLAISESRWEQLPSWAQDVLVEAGSDATTHFAGMVDGLGEEATQTLQDEYGLTAVELSNDEVAELREILAPLKEKWASQSGGDFDHQAAMDEAIAAIESASK